MSFPGKKGGGANQLSDLSDWPSPVNNQFLRRKSDGSGYEFAAGVAGHTLDSLKENMIVVTEDDFGIDTSGETTAIQNANDAAIAAALDYLHATYGGWLIFPRGVIAFNDAIAWSKTLTSDNHPIRVTGQGTKGTIFRSYCAETVTPMRTNPTTSDVIGDNDLNGNSEVMLEHFQLDVRNSFDHGAGIRGLSVPWLKFKGTKGGFCKNLRLTNSLSTGTPHASSVGILAFPINGIQTTFDQIICLGRVEKGIKSHLDWAEWRQLFLQDINSIGFEHGTASSPYNSVVKNAQYFQSGGSLIYCSASDSGEVRDLILEGYLSEESEPNTGLGTKLETVYHNQPSGAKVYVQARIATRDYSSSQFNKYGGAGERNILIYVNPFHPVVGHDVFLRQERIATFGSGTARVDSRLPAAALGNFSLVKTTSGYRLTYGTGTGANAIAGLWWQDVVQRRHRPLLKIMASMPTFSGTAVRAFFGLSSLTPANMLASASPSGEYIGIAYAQDGPAPYAGDWCFLSSDGSTVSRSGTVPGGGEMAGDTNAKQMFIDVAQSGRGAGLQLDTAINWQKIYRDNAKANVPADTTDLNPMAVITNAGTGANKEIGILDFRGWW